MESIAARRAGDNAAWGVCDGAADAWGGSCAESGRGGSGAAGATLGEVAAVDGVVEPGEAKGGAPGLTGTCASDGGRRGGMDSPRLLLGVCLFGWICACWVWVRKVRSRQTTK